jgi:hypothetical protein
MVALGLLMTPRLCQSNASAIRRRGDENVTQSEQLAAIRRADRIDPVLASAAKTGHSPVEGHGRFGYDQRGYRRDTRAGKHP